MKRNYLSVSTQRGAAIIVALFVMSIVAAAAVAMMLRGSIDVRRTQLILTADQATLYAQGSIAWAMNKLTMNWIQKNPKKIIDQTPIHSKTDQLDGFTITSTIEDMQSFFNINNLSTSEHDDYFMRLLQIVEPNIEPAAANNLILAIRDWVSPIVKNSGYDNDYEKQNPPYRSPHRPMVSISELRLVKNMTPTLFNKLSFYLTALPEVTPINVNNAAAPLLMSMSPTFTNEAAKVIMLYRQKTPFLTPQQFLNFDIVKNNHLTDTNLTTVSNYFLVKTFVTAGKQKIILYTLLLRTIDNNKPSIAVAWQTKGTL